MFFIVILGDLDGAGTFCPLALKQHSKAPHYNGKNGPYIIIAEIFPEHASDLAISGSKLSTNLMIIAAWIMSLCVAFPMYIDYPGFSNWTYILEHLSSKSVIVWHTTLVPFYCFQNVLSNKYISLILIII